MLEGESRADSVIGCKDVRRIAEFQRGLDKWDQEANDHLQDFNWVGSVSKYIASIALNLSVYFNNH